MNKSELYMGYPLKGKGWKVDRFEYDEENNITKVIVKPVIDYKKIAKNIKTSRDV